MNIFHLKTCLKKTVFPEKSILFSIEPGFFKPSVSITEKFCNFTADVEKMPFA
jgi:hypothetical protein